MHRHVILAYTCEFNVTATYDIWGYQTRGYGGLGQQCSQSNPGENEFESRTWNFVDHVPLFLNM